MTNKDEPAKLKGGGSTVVFGKKTKIEKQRDFLEAENLRLRSAIEWALGAREDFKPQGETKAKYWWRKELSERAGLVWDGERYMMANGLITSGVKNENQSAA